MMKETKEMIHVVGEEWSTRKQRVGASAATKSVKELKSINAFSDTRLFSPHRPSIAIRKIDNSIAGDSSLSSRIRWAFPAASGGDKRFVLARCRCLATYVQRQIEKEREYKFTKYGHEIGSSHKPFGYHNSAKITRGKYDNKRAQDSPKAGRTDQGR